jgi:hypothetical protein
MLKTAARAAALGLLVAGAAGCAGYGADQGFARFIPSAETARQALELTLAAWAKGESPGPVNEVPIEVVDTQRRGQRLERFTILGETSGNGPRCFAARLQLDGPREERTARFVVLGQSPLWVMRYEDYEMLAHWECRRLDNNAKDQQAADGQK